MSTTDELKEVIERIVSSQWEITDGRVVPEDHVGLGVNKAVRLEATLLYADLADSTEMAMRSRTIAAEVYKAFLACCSKIIRLRDGHIRSFDGDRVMGVFIGDHKNTNAASAALNIAYAFRKLLVPRFKEQYDVFKDGTLGLAHCTGVDTGTILVAEAGIRDNNDLVWVGRAPNLAAKLSTRRNASYWSYVTERVHKSMNQSARVSRDGQAM